MRTFGLVIAAAGLAACVARQDSATPEAAPPSDAEPVAETWPWPDATSDSGGLTMRLRPLVGEYSIATDAGPGFAMEAHFATDDPDVILAGGPRASILSPASTLARTAFDAAGEDTWSCRTSDHGRTAIVIVPAAAAGTRLVDLEVRCRLLRVREWTTHDVGSFGAGRREDIAADPYALSVECQPDGVIVSATMPGRSRSAGADRDDIGHLLDHSWAALSVEVRDANGALLDATSEMGTERASTTEFQSGTREHRGPIAYPVAVRLRVPKTYDLEYPTFTWHGISLPTSPVTVPKGAASRSEHDPPPLSPAPTDYVREALTSPWPWIFVKRPGVHEGSDAYMDAPAADFAVARTYATVQSKGALSGSGERLTLLTEKATYAVNEEIRVLHVYEATRPGLFVHVCGPKSVCGETLDGKLVTPAVAEPAPYDGPVIPSPWIDCAYEVTTYKLPAGRHVLRWTSKPSEFDDGPALTSNELFLDVR
jgi:hypothetical protein